MSMAPATGLPSCRWRSRQVSRFLWPLNHWGKWALWGECCGWEADDRPEAGGVVGGGLEVGGAGVGLGGGADDGQAKPRSGVVVAAGAGVVEAGEAVEGPLPVGLRYAGAVVGHGQLDPRTGLADRHRDRRLGVADRVVDQVDQHPVEPVAVPPD